MIKLLIFTLVGLGAQIVDGTLGMAFGVTATTLLVFTGVGAAHASAAVHFAEVATTLASGVSHWRFGNVDKRVLLRLGIPGGIGAFLGATVLSRLSTESAAPITAGILLAIGVYLIYRFSTNPPRGNYAPTTPFSARFLAPLGLFGGFIDASGGGGWGPITTSTLLTSGKAAPRTVIGSVSASEFIVAVSASIGFLFGLGSEFFNNLIVIAGLALGGVIAAPIAAWLVSRVNSVVLGTAVGGVLVLTNARTLLRYFDTPDSVRTPIYLVIVIAWAALVAYTWRKAKLTPAEAAGDLSEIAGGAETPRAPADTPGDDIAATPK
ncbi:MULTISPECIES: sulfite exporter TauE/SafE family protein [unclassified Mycobacterium]|uniref:sulfite exporter TauE/SafE family protein n=1 Tax=unclassified Mycobacterium TaxID=2642494 RepID=UPI00099296C7|nr:MULTISPECIES: sulfite exporter TauE/SafE family protein [unclassified Mycobacterium]